MASVAQLMKNMDEMKELFTARMAGFESSVPRTGSDTTAIFEEFKTFKAFIWKAVASLQAQMELVARSLDDLEMRSRSKMLLLHGVPETEVEDIMATVINVCTGTLQMHDVDRGSLRVCRRLGSRARNSKARPLLLRFSTYLLREAVWGAKTKLKGSAMMLSEFLTSNRHSVFVEARRVYGVKHSWTSGGRIVVSTGGTRHKVTTMVELRALPPPTAEDAAGSAPPVSPRSETGPVPATQMSEETGGRTRRKQRIAKP